MSNNDLIKRIDELEGTIIEFGKMLAELYVKAGLNRGSIEILNKAVMQVADQLAEDSKGFYIGVEFADQLQKDGSRPKTKHACSCGESDCAWCGS